MKLSVYKASLLGFSLVYAFSVSAYSVENKVQANELAKKVDDNSTQHSFEDLLVQGKFHFTDEAVSTVEEDKVLDALIGIRTDFKDRIQQSSGSY